MKRYHVYRLVVVAVLFAFALQVAAFGDDNDALPATQPEPSGPGIFFAQSDPASLVGPANGDATPAARVGQGSAEDEQISSFWSEYRRDYSSCTVDLSKRTMNFALEYPLYQWSHPLAQGNAYIRHWLYFRDDTIDWVYYNPTPYYPDAAGNVIASNIVFDENLLWQLNAGMGIDSKTEYLGGFPLVPGQTVQYAWLREVLLYDVGGIAHAPIYEWVPFWNSGLTYVCWYTLPAASQALFVASPVLPLQVTPTIATPPNLPSVANGLPAPRLGGAAAATPPSMPTPAHYSYIQLPMIFRSSTSAATPQPQPSPTATSTVIFEPPPTISSPSTTGNMGNANFDAGPNGIWTEYSSRGLPIVMNGPKGFEARSGEYLAWLGGANDDISSVSQTITVPSTHPYLSLYLMASSEEELCYYDHATIWIDEYAIATVNLCKSNNVHSWVRGQIDMHPFVGQTVDFSIRVENDSTLLSHLFLDDLTFESGVGLPTATPTPVFTPTPQPGGAIRNPGFELGDNGDWRTGSSYGYGNIFLNDGSHSGDWLAWLGGAHNEQGFIEQTLSIPHDRPYLTYWGWVASEETTCGPDNVMILAGSAEIFGYSLCKQYNSSSWSQWWVNLNDYTGTTQRIRIRLQTNGALLSSLYLDDFAFAATPPSLGMASGPGVESAGGPPALYGSESAQTLGPVAASEPEAKAPGR